MTMLLSVYTVDRIIKYADIVLYVNTPREFCHRLQADFLALSDR